MSEYVKPIPGLDDWITGHWGQEPFRNNNNKCPFCGEILYDGEECPNDCKPYYYFCPECEEELDEEGFCNTEDCTFFDTYTMDQAIKLSYNNIHM